MEHQSQLRAATPRFTMRLYLDESNLTRDDLTLETAANALGLTIYLP